MPTPLPHSLRVPTEASGKRLDAFLASRMHGCGVRGAKRLILAGGVHVEGKLRPPHWKLREGETVLIFSEPAGPLLPQAVFLAAATARYAAFAKPTGLHTAAMAGSMAPSLEMHVAAHWSQLRENWFLQESDALARQPLSAFAAEVMRKLHTLARRDVPSLSGSLPQWEASCGEAIPEDPPVLVSRLDGATSGLVAAAFSDEDIARFRENEAQCLASKYYLAVARGRMPAPMILRGRLDTANRHTSKVLSEDSPDPARWTHVTPLHTVEDDAALPFDGPFDAQEQGLGNQPGGAPEPSPVDPGLQNLDEGPLTLVAARIHRGARHQIRAHLAAAGFPLLGDALYGTWSHERLFLHHALLITPGFTASLAPDWLGND